MEILTGTKSCKNIGELMLVLESPESENNVCIGPLIWSRHEKRSMSDKMIEANDCLLSDERSLLVEMIAKINARGRISVVEIVASNPELYGYLAIIAFDANADFIKINPAESAALAQIRKMISGRYGSGKVEQMMSRILLH